MKKILVVIDMQNDFINGSLGSDEAQNVVDAVSEKIKEYDVKNIYVTRDTHTEDYLNTNEGRHLPVIHCIKNSKGWQLNEKIETATEGAVVIDKTTFASVELAHLLKAENNKEALEIELVGLCTDICVISNALLLKAFMPEVSIKVDSSCCAGVTPDSHRMALETMKMCQIDVI